MGRTSTVGLSLNFDLGRLTLSGPLRAGLVTGVATIAALGLGEARMAVPLIVGALFVGLADPPDTTPRRLRTLGATAASCAAATLTGGLVSQTAFGHVAAGMVVAAVCAYAGVLGSRAAMAGVLALVVFLISAGTPTSPTEALTDAGLLLAGGILQIAVVAAAALVTGHDAGPRRAVATGFRELAANASPDHLDNPAIDTALATAGDVAGRTTDGPDVARWLHGLVDDARQARLGLLSVSHDPGVVDSPGAGRPTSVAAAAAVCRQLARALVLPWRRGGLRQRLADLDVARQHDIAHGHHPDVLAVALDPLVHAAAMVTGTWPRPARPRSAAMTDPPAPGITRRLVPQPTYVNHAIRLAVAIGLGITFSRLVDLPHAYWLPLTVAWVARPDLGSTINRVVLRVVGTLVGASVIAAVFVLTDPGVVGLAVLVTAGAVVANAFLAVNYATAVVGITAIMLTIFASLGEPVERDLLLRIAATVAGGALVAAVALVRPLRSEPRTLTAVTNAVDHLRAYAAAVLLGDGSLPGEHRADTQAALASAHEALASTEHEPGHHAMSPATGHRVLTGVMVATAHLFATEQVTGAPGTPPGDATATDGLHDRSLAALDDVGNTLRDAGVGGHHHADHSGGLSDTDGSDTDEGPQGRATRAISQLRVTLTEGA